MCVGGGGGGGSVCVREREGWCFTPHTERLCMCGRTRVRVRARV